MELRIKELEQENEFLKKSLDVLEKKYAKVKDLSQQQRMIQEKLEKECNHLIDTVSEMNCIKIQNSKLEFDNENLRKELNNVQLKYATLLEEINKDKPIKLRREATDIATARILRAYLDYDKVETVIGYLKERYGYETAPAKVYRTISVSEPIDYKRILTIYRAYSEEFEGIEETDIVKWFSVKRRRKLKLMNEEELREKYGIALVKQLLPTLTDDDFVKGYYDQEPFKKAKESK